MVRCAGCGDAWRGLAACHMCGGGSGGGGGTTRGTRFQGAHAGRLGTPRLTRAACTVIEAEARASQPRWCSPCSRSDEIRMDGPCSLPRFKPHTPAESATRWYALMHARDITISRGAPPLSHRQRSRWLQVHRPCPGAFRCFRRPASHLMAPHMYSCTLAACNRLTTATTPPCPGRAGQARQPRGAAQHLGWQRFAAARVAAAFQGVHRHPRCPSLQQ